MITHFITNVSTRFNPFSAGAKSARLFLTSLPPSARANGMSIVTELLPRTSTAASTLHIKFKDGKQLNLDCENLGIKSIVEEVDRHSRALQKQADIDG
ncbi:39S ribosomal protein L53/MRP-L53-domain-containing protein [Lasiosphaeria hispida]|uniref:Large ribosomal subunit protein mL53 n=1 Tax=Lasiosphaeria hispida TaxID=260671 RepID=A0AAJ0H6R6_9PEZI|nr:39S ribosomal protein L53/MRP-L53-domain-containing protein [Lasiosphaeria hispida]